MKKTVILMTLFLPMAAMADNLALKNVQDAYNACMSKQTSQTEREVCANTESVGLNSVLKAFITSPTPESSAAQKAWQKFRAADRVSVTSSYGGGNAGVLAATLNDNTLVIDRINELQNQ